MFYTITFLDVKISKRVARSAALNVINNHKASIEEIHKLKNYNADRKSFYFCMLTLIIFYYFCFISIFLCISFYYFFL